MNIKDVSFAYVDRMPLRQRTKRAAGGADAGQKLTQLQRK
ncbi:hypothetical protein M2142_001202 [Fusobacterium sp. PH5-29]